VGPGRRDRGNTRCFLRYSSYFRISGCMLQWFFKFMVARVGLSGGDTLWTRSGPEGSSRSSRFGQQPIRVSESGWLEPPPYYMRVKVWVTKY